MENTKTNVRNFAILQAGVRNILAIVFATVIAFTMTGCPDPSPDPGTKDVPPEDQPVEKRWSNWVNPGSTVTLDCSVDDDGVCTIIVGGTPEADDDIWKANAGYSYTAKAGASYIYTFKAWTESGTRQLNVQYYWDEEDSVALNDIVEITNIQTTYTVNGNKIPKGGKRYLAFNCANQTGTFYVKILSIIENQPNSGDNGDQPLPAASGINAVSGKTYYESWGDKITFSVTAEGDVKGTYVIGYPDIGTYASGVKFTYRDVGTGSYTWNEGAKTITLKPEKITDSRDPLNRGGDNVEVRGEYEMRDRTAYRSFFQDFLNQYKQQMGEDVFNQFLLSQGFSSSSDYIDYLVNLYFANITSDYSFSTDGTALFLQINLPVNKGANEVSGQTYNGGSRDEYANITKDTNQVYVFTASEYTFTDSNVSTTETGTYSCNYNANQEKRVTFKPLTIGGKDMAAYYAAQTAPSGHHFVDDNAYRAAQTNEAFRMIGHPYNSTDKIIVTNATTIYFYY